MSDFQDSIDRAIKISMEVSMTCKGKKKKGSKKGGKAPKGKQ